VIWITISSGDCRVISRVSMVASVPRGARTTFPF
jgi:hypothetical protein